MKRLVFATVLFSKLAFGQWIGYYTCSPIECASVDGPSYLVLAEVDILGQCWGDTFPAAQGAAFAACTSLQVTAFAYGSVSESWDDVGWVEVDDGFVDLGNTGYVRQDCNYNEWDSPPFIDGC